MDAIVWVHNVLRWLVLLAGVAALGVALMSWLGSGVPDKLPRQSMLVFALSLDVQVLLGIAIWLLENRWADGGRQFKFEHPLIMVIALVVAHVAAARARRSPSQQAAVVRTVGASLSLLLILVGIPWTR